MIALTVVCLALIALVAFLLWDRRVERREHTAEREMLHQRLQAPDIAVIQHQVASFPEQPQALPWDDDQAFHATREDMAEALKR